MSTDLQSWRECMGYTQRQAASALGMTLKAYGELERGKSYDTGKPMLPDKRTLLACAALVKKLKPWGKRGPMTKEDALKFLASLRSKKYIVPKGVCSTCAGDGVLTPCGQMVADCPDCKGTGKDAMV